MIRLGIIGCGAMAGQHAAGIDFAALKDRITVTALASRTETGAAALRDAFFGGAEVRSDYHDIFPFVDAVLLTLPIPAHYAVAKDCLLAGKHVLLEKPMAETEDECLELCRIAAEKKLVFQQGLCLRYDEGMQALKELAESGCYGRLRQLSVYTEAPASIPASHWLAKITDPRLGVLFHHGVHYIDLLMWILGTPTDGALVCSDGFTPIRPDAVVDAILRFENGATGFYYCDWAAKAGSTREFSVEAYFENALVETNIFRGITHIYTGGHRGGTEVSDDGNGHTETITRTPCRYLHSQLEGFAGEIEKGGEGYPSGAESVRVLAVIRQLYEKYLNGTMKLSL